MEQSKLLDRVVNAVNFTGSRRIDNRSKMLGLQKLFYFITIQPIRFSQHKNNVDQKSDIIVDSDMLFPTNNVSSFSTTVSKNSDTMTITNDINFLY